MPAGTSTGIKHIYKIKYKSYIDPYCNKINDIQITTATLDLLMYILNPPRT